MDDEIKRRVLKEIDAEFCVSVCQFEHNIPFLGPNQQVRVSSQNVKWGNYDADWNEVTPIDEELIYKMRECEAVYMDMLTRLEERHPFIYQDRKRAYLRSLQYWNHILDKHKINLYLSSGIPHESHEYVIYSLCKQKGIPTIFGHSGPVQDTKFFVTDWEESAVGMEEAIESLKTKYSKPEEIPLKDKFEKFYQSHLANRDNAPVPWDMVNKFNNPFAKWFGVVKNVFKNGKKDFLEHVFKFIVRWINPRYWVFMFDRLRRKMRVNSMMRFYDKHAPKPDLNKKFVYFPLHMQPECSTNPMAGAYSDQLLIAKMLNGLLPEDCLIYVKEHPNQPRQYPDGRGRDVHFYKDLLSLDKVRFAPTNFNSLTLLKSSIAVATGTGTVSMEALFHERPVLLFGHTFFQYAPSIFPIHSNEDCRNAIKEIQNGAKPSLLDVRIFLKAMEQVAQEGTFARDYQERPEWTGEENIRSMVEGFVGKIKEVR